MPQPKGDLARHQGDRHLDADGNGGDHLMFFIKIPPHSSFERGVWIPYLTQLEAERQVANDLLSTDFIEGIYESDVIIPKWQQMDHVDGFPKHVYPDHHTKVMNLKEL